MRAEPCSANLAASFLVTVLQDKANPRQEMMMVDLLKGRCFVVLDDGDNAIGAYVLNGQGAEVWVQAAAGRPDVGFDLCDLLDDLIARHGAGFESIGFRTYRGGLVRKALRRGYEVVSREDGHIMRKKLK
ncbi:MAG: hypothetical protein V4476_19550 [Pseudomonadota bacterium]